MNIHIGKLILYLLRLRAFFTEINNELALLCFCFFFKFRNVGFVILMNFLKKLN